MSIADIDALRMEAKRPQLASLYKSNYLQNYERETSWQTLFKGIGLDIP